MLRGLCRDTPAPSFFSLPATKAKWTAWEAQGQKYANDIDSATQRYLEIARNLGHDPATSKKGGMGVGGASVSVLAKEEELEQQGSVWLADGVGIRTEPCKPISA